MIILTEEEWELVRKNYKLTADDLYKVIKKRASFEEIRDLLFSTKSRKNASDFYHLLWNFPHSMNDSEVEKLYQIFLKEKWHQWHDHLVGDFQLKFNKNTENIDLLVGLIADLPDFNKDDDALKYPLIRKCMYAIEAQPRPESTNALLKLSHHEDEKVRRYALHQLEKGN